MARYAATVPWTSTASGNVLALPHPGGILLTPLTMRHLWIEGPLPRELRAQVKRHNATASGGSVKSASASFDDGAAKSKSVVLYGPVSFPGEQSLDFAIPTRLRTYGARENVFDLGTFTVGVGHSLVVELLDGDAMAASAPLSMVIVWDE